MLDIKKLLTKILQSLATTVTNVAYDSTNKKLTKTINGTASDIVTVATLKTALSLTKSDVGLSNVTNTAQVTNVAYDSTNKKLTKTIGSSTTDIVTVDTLKTALSLAKEDVGLGNVTNVEQAPKTTAVTNVAYDSTNAKITKTINGTTSNVVTIATLTTAIGCLLDRGATTNLNNATSTGLYTYSSSATNRPGNVNAGGSLLVIAYSSAYVWQLAFMNSSSTTATNMLRIRRTSSSGTWQDWKIVAWQ